MIKVEFLEMLEELALIKKRCEIVFFDEGERITIIESIGGIYQMSEPPVLQLQSRKEIALEKLISVNGITNESVC